MPDEVARSAFAMLHLDSFIQYFGVVLSVIGVGCTIYAMTEFAKRSVQMNYVQAAVARSHMVGQFAVLAVQLIFLVINLLVLTLPDVPVAMYLGSPDGAWTVSVILGRKLLRQLCIVILAVSSIHRIWTFHRIVAVLSHPSDYHLHRRKSDPRPS